MKNKFTIYDCTLRNQKDMLPKVQDLERASHTFNGFVLRTFTDFDQEDLKPRRGFNDLLEYLKRGTTDVLIVYELPRLALSIKSLADTLALLRTLGVELIVVREDINTLATTDSSLWLIGEALETITRMDNSRKSRKGVARARMRGSKIGRPGLDEADVRMAIKYIQEQWENPVDALQPWQVQKKCGISSASFYGIRTVMTCINQAMPISHVLQKVTIGERTVSLVYKLYKPNQKELPKL